MVVLIIFIAILLLIFAVPYGVDASDEDSVVRLGIKAGPFRIWLLPKKPKTEKQLLKQQRREVKKAEKAADKKAKERNQTQTVKPKKKLDIPFLCALVKIGCRAVRRTFRSFTVDHLKLHYVVATKDPYDTATQYSYLCGALASVPEIVGDVVRVRRQDVQLGMDFTREKPVISARIVISLQLYKLVWVALMFAVEFMRWKKTHPTPDVAANERKIENGREQDQRTDGCNHEQDQTAC